MKMSENTQAFLLSLPSLLVACCAAIAVFAFVLCLIDAVVASYSQLLTRGRFIDLDAHEGLIAPVGFLKKKLRAKSWWQVVVRIWLVGAILAVSSGALGIIGGLVLRAIKGST